MLRIAVGYVERSDMHLCGGLHRDPGSRTGARGCMVHFTALRYVQCTLRIAKHR